MNTNYNFLEQFGKSFIESNDIAQHFYISFDDRRSKWYEGINEYPAIYAVVRSVVLGQQVINWTVDFYFLDLLLDDKSNENSVMNNTLELANQFQNFVYQNKGNGFETDGRPIAQPLNNFDNNKMNGWRVAFNFETPREQCFGSEGFEPTQLCADATYRVEYEDGTLIEEGTIPSGGSVTVEVPFTVKTRLHDWNSVNNYSYCGVAEGSNIPPTEEFNITRIEIFADGTTEALTAVGAWNDRETLIYN